MGELIGEGGLSTLLKLFQEELSIQILNRSYVIFLRNYLKWPLYLDIMYRI